MGDNHRDDYHIDVGAPDPFDSIFRGRGVGRVVCALGLTVSLAGFGSWIWLILAPMLAEPDGMPDSPFKVELVSGIPMAPAAFVAVVVGGVIAMIGASMAKAARRRHDDAAR